jgi:FkbM family methyltransferase
MLKYILFIKLGQYSLFAAAMGRKVVTVEPFHDNILRIHKAAYLEKTYKNILLIKNAISNKRNEIKLLGTNNDNIGGQSLLDHKDKIYKKDKNNKYLVETILFDDIVPYLPYKNDTTKERFKKAILKIDIEGFEPFAFEHASLLFEILDIRIIYMEWGNLPKQTNEYDKIIAMIEFLYLRNYQAFVDNKLLEKNNWSSWPWDIIWIKKKEIN